MLSTVRSHDQWNTTIYSDNDRYRGVKNLRTLVFMNSEDMARPRPDEFDLSTSPATPATAAPARSGATARSRTTSPRGSVTGYMPELNVLCALSDSSSQSDQPLTKHQIVEVTPARTA